jgi:hypothetical protein
MVRSSRLPDALYGVLVDQGRVAPPRRTFRLSEICPGWDVVDNRDELIGTVVVVEDGFLEVRRGFLQPRLYVPLDGIGQVQEGVVSLNVPASWLGGLGWDRRPRVANDHAGGR